MKKIEMEQHRQQYCSLVEKATTAEKRRDFQSAIQHAEASWEYLDGTLRLLNKEGKQSDLEAEGIHLVLKYAPLLFEYAALDRLESFLKGKRRIAQAASSDLTEEIEKARAWMWRAHAIWDQLERQPKCKLNTLRLGFSGDENLWHSTIRTWELMGVIVTFSQNGISFLRLATRMNDVVAGKCARCGTIARTTKSALLEPITCDKCRKAEIFVQIDDTQLTES